ncbi:hypothetical protein [Empedobacter tilapiae]|nr:hypothetical protein [Empedobacter tilapiae]
MQQSSNKWRRSLWSISSFKNSPMVTGGALELYVTIIMKGYDPQP